MKKFKFVKNTSAFLLCMVLVFSVVISPVMAANESIPQSSSVSSPDLSTGSLPAASPEEGPAPSSQASEPSSQVSEPSSQASESLAVPNAPIEEIEEIIDTSQITSISSMPEAEPVPEMAVSQAPVSSSDEEKPVSSLIDEELEAQALPAALQKLDIATIETTNLFVDGTKQAAPTQITITKDTIIELHYTWKMNDGVDTTAINEGDHSILGQLPSGLPFAANLTQLNPIEIKTTDDKHTIGSVTFDGDGNIILTYNTEVKGLDKVKGDFMVQSKINFDSVTVPGEKKDLIMNADGSFTFVKTGETGVAISKKFLCATRNSVEITNEQSNVDTLEWQIDINTNEKKINNAQLTDIVSNTINNSHPFMAKRHYFKSIRVEVYPLTLGKLPSGNIELTPGIVLTDTTAANADNGQYKAGLSGISGSEDTMKIELGNITKAYRIIVKSDVDYSYNLGKVWSYVNHINTATLTGTDESDNPVSETAIANKELQVGATTSKWGKIAVDSAGNQTISWFVYINRMHLDFGTKGEDVTLTDTLSAGHEFVESPTLTNYELYPATFNALTGLVLAGSKIADPVAANEIHAKPAVTVNNTVMTVKFKNLNNKGYSLRYKTKVTNAAIFSNTGAKNNVKYTIDTDREGKASTTVTAPAVVGDVKLSKEALVDEMTHNTLSWNVVYDTGEGTAQTPMVISDDFGFTAPCSMKMIESSLVVKLNGTKLNKGTDYEIKQGMMGTGIGKDSYDKGFQVTILGNSGIKGKLTLAYKTNYTLPDAALDADLGAKKGATFGNTIRASAKINSNTFETSLRVNKSQVVPARFGVNGLKSGAFTQDGGTTIGWTIDLNPRGVDLGNKVKFVDTFGANLVFKGGLDALKVYSVNGQTETLLTENTEYKVVTSPVGSEQGFALEFASMGAGSHARVKYETDLKDPNLIMRAYMNFGEMTAPDRSSNSIKFSGEAIRPGDKGYLLKEVKTDANDSNLLHFSLEVNKEKKTLTDAVITDKMGRGLVLQENSIKVALNADGTGLLTEGTHYELSGGDIDASGAFTEFEIKFIGSYSQFDKTVYVLYSAKLDADAAPVDPSNPNNHVVSNEACLVASEVTKWDTVDKSTFITSASGAASGKETMFLQIKKADDKTAALLAGAEFKLLKSDGSTLKDNIVVKSTGFSDAIRIERGVYTLVETKAPSGYTLPTGAAAQTTVDVSAGDKTVTIEVKNTKVPDTSSTTSSEPGSSSTTSSQPGPSSTTSSQPGPSSTTSSLSSTPSSSAPSSKPPTPTKSKPPVSSVPKRSSVPTVVTTAAATPPAPLAPPPAPLAPPPAPPVPLAPPALPIVPLATLVAPVAPVVNLPLLRGDIVPNTEAETEKIDIENTPLAGLGKAWSLLNLMMSLVSIFAAAVLIARMMKRRKLNEQNDEEGQDELEQTENSKTEKRSRLTAIRLPSIIMGLAPGLLFLVLENIRLPMTWITQWTPIIGAFFIIHMALLVIYSVVSKREKDAKIQENNFDNEDVQPV